MAPASTVCVIYCWKLPLWPPLGGQSSLKMRQLWDHSHPVRHFKTLKTTVLRHKAQQKKDRSDQVFKRTKTRQNARIREGNWFPFGSPAFDPVVPIHAPGGVPVDRRTGGRVFDTLHAMELDWHGKLILRKLEEGCTIRESAAAVGISRQAVLKRKNASPDFAQAVAAAREAGKAERTFRLWLRHRFRGKRPPTGKGHGGVPRFTYGRR